MSRKIAPSEAKAQDHTALLQGQTTVASDKELLNAWCERLSGNLSAPLCIYQAASWR